MFVTHPTKRSTFKGFQIWLNLPARLKMCEPSYEMIWHNDMPTARLPGVEVKVVAGQVGDVRSRIVKSVPVSVLHVIMEPGARFSQPMPATQNSFAYVFEGDAGFGPDGRVQAVKTHSWAVFASDGDVIEARNVGSSKLQFLLLGGQPYNVRRHIPRA